MPIILVVGGSYAGHQACKTLMEYLPSNCRIVLLERNSHFNHVYAFPRFSVLPGNEHKAFIPYDNLFKSKAKNNHEFIHGSLTFLGNLLQKIAYYRSLRGSQENKVERQLPYDYLVYAVGSQRSSSIDLWRRRNYGGDKAIGMEVLQRQQQRIKASDVVILGGGALGIQLASDIVSTYNNDNRKRVTLVSSSPLLLKHFDPIMHDIALQWLKDHGVKVILGKRGKIVEKDENGRIIAQVTDAVRVIETDLILECTGLKPVTEYLGEAVGTTHRRGAPVNQYLQLMDRDEIYD